MDKVSNKHLNNEHRDWVRSLAFYKEQIVLLKERLTELAKQGSKEDIPIQLDHFENQFKIQQTNIDTLSHNIRSFLHHAADQAAANDGFVERDLFNEHEELRDQFIQEEKTIHELRHDFNKFASKWM